MCIGGLGQVTAVVSDCRDRIYVLMGDKAPTVRILNMRGEKIGSVSRVSELISQFPPLTYPVDAQGYLHLEAVCLSPGPNTCAKAGMKSIPERAVFDLQGNLVTALPVLAPPTYAATGVYISQAWDSELYRCQWHRIIIRGDLPAGSMVQVSTHTAEALYPDDQIIAAGLEWETNQIAHELQNGEWDCLVRSGLGRYLWLKIELRGNGKVTPEIESITIEFPRISLRRYLPPVFGEEPISADLTDRFLALYDTTIRSIESKIDYLARYFDPLSAPADERSVGQMDFLTWLGTWIGVGLDRNWPDVKRRQFLKKAGKLFDLRGTREGLWRQLLLFLGIDAERICCPHDQPMARCRPKPFNCEPVKKAACHWQPPPLILEHFKLRRWLFVGAARLGDQAVLWGNRIVNRSQLNEEARMDRSQLITTQDPYRDPFHVYAHKFTVFVPASY
jgi:phage tail-like protein